MSELKKSRLCRQIEDKVNINNAIKLFSTSTVFNHSNLSKLSFGFIERGFPIVADSNDFLELDFIYVAKVLQSHELSIDTELQVFNAAEFWLNYNKERSNYAKPILSRIRLSLLSVPTLNNISDKESVFTKNAECVDIINEVLKHNKFKLEFHSTKITSNSRYCNQNNFNIILCGGEDDDTENSFNDVYSIEANNIGKVSNLPQMKNACAYFDMVSTKGEVYVLGGIGKNNHIKSIEKYSPFTDTWEKVANMHDNRSEFTASSFMDNIYIIGGTLPNMCYTRNDSVKSCVKFNTKCRTWRQCAVLNGDRCQASSVVFEGKIVVSGGFSWNAGSLNSVEVYDHMAGSWSYMPNMIERRYEHISVAVKNKLFILGGAEIFCEIFCEMFDTRCNKFIKVKPPPNSLTFDILRPESVISIGSKLAVFGNQTYTILFFDVEKEEWCEEPFEVTRKLMGYRCTKVASL